MESLLFPIIMLAVTLIGGGILLLFLKTSKRSPQLDEPVLPCRRHNSLSISRIFGINICIPVTEWYLSM